MENKYFLNAFKLSKIYPIGGTSVKIPAVYKKLIRKEIEYSPSCNREVLHKALFYIYVVLKVLKSKLKTSRELEGHKI